MALLLGLVLVNLICVFLFFGVFQINETDETISEGTTGPSLRFRGFRTCLGLQFLIVIRRKPTKPNRSNLSRIDFRSTTFLYVVEKKQKNRNFDRKNHKLRSKMSTERRSSSSNPMTNEENAMYVPPIPFSLFFFKIFHLGSWLVFISCKSVGKNTSFVVQVSCYNLMMNQLVNARHDCSNNIVFLVISIWI